MQLLTKIQRHLVPFIASASLCQAQAERDNHVAVSSLPDSTVSSETLAIKQQQIFSSESFRKQALQYKADPNLTNAAELIQAAFGITAEVRVTGEGKEVLVLQSVRLKHSEAAQTKEAAPQTETIAVEADPVLVKYLLNRQLGLSRLVTLAERDTDSANLGKDIAAMALILTNHFDKADNTKTTPIIQKSSPDLSSLLVFLAKAGLLETDKQAGYISSSSFNKKAEIEPLLLSIQNGMLQVTFMENANFTTVIPQDIATARLLVIRPILLCQEIGEVPDTYSCKTIADLIVDS